MRELTGLEKKIVNIASRGIEAVSRPYEKIAAEAGCGEGEVIETLERLMKEGRVRRLSAVLRQRKLGYAANAMCVFDVSDENADAAGEFAAGLAGVSHCYKRARAEGWPYNLYAMIHSRTMAECAAAAAEIAGRAGARDYKLLYSVKEFKKENMIYFETADSSSAADFAADGNCGEAGGR